jgi:hypothetical protein
MADATHPANGRKEGSIPQGVGGDLLAANIKAERLASSSEIGIRFTAKDSVGEWRE